MKMTTNQRIILYALLSFEQISITLVFIWLVNYKGISQWWYLFMILWILGTSPSNIFKIVDGKNEDE